MFTIRFYMSPVSCVLKDCKQFLLQMHPSSSEVLIAKKSYVGNISMRATLNTKGEFEPSKNISSVIAAIENKKKSLSTYNNKNYQSYSTSALPAAVTIQQHVNNCESATQNKNKFDKHENKSKAQHNQIESLQKRARHKDSQSDKTNYFKFKNEANKFRAQTETSQNNYDNKLQTENIGRTSYANMTVFVPKHRQGQWLQKMEIYSRTAKSPKIGIMERIKENDQQQSNSPKVAIKTQSPIKDSYNKVFFRQTLDPKMDRNSIVNKMYAVTPNNLDKKLIEKDNSTSNLQKKIISKNDHKTNVTQQNIGQSGSFWRKKAVSPPSKQLSPLRQVESDSQKEIKIPMLHLHSHDKTQSSVQQKSAFFMNKKSLSRFSIVKNIGSGTYSDAFLGMDKKSSAIFCIKRFHKATFKNFPQVLNNFIRKVAFQILADHPNIIQLYDIFADGDFVYTVEQYMQGGRLSQCQQRQIEQRQAKRRQTLDFTKKQPNEQPLFSQAKIIDKMFDVNSALCYLHQSCSAIVKHGKKLPPLAHGDVRTKSLMVNLGVCKLASIEPAHTKSYYIDSFSPPQQIIQQVYIPKSDIWSLGLVLFQLCAQRRLFGNEGEHQQQGHKPGYQVFNVNITEEIDKLSTTPQLLKDLLKRLLTIQPEDRPASNVVMLSNVFRVYGFDTQWKERRQQKIIKEKDLKFFHKKHTQSLQQVRQQSASQVSTSFQNDQSFNKNEFMNEMQQQFGQCGPNSPSHAYSQNNNHNNNIGSKDMIGLHSFTKSKHSNANLNYSRQSNMNNNTHDSIQCEQSNSTIPNNSNNKAHWTSKKVGQ